MKDTKHLSFKDLMQMSQDMEELDKDLGMFVEFMGTDELRTILKEEKDG